MAPKERNPMGQGTTPAWDERRNKWVGWVRLGRDPKGKLVRRKVYGDTRADCAQEMRRLRAEVDGGATPISGNTTLAEYLDAWLEDQKPPTLRPRTWRSYESIIRVHLKPRLGAAKLADLQPRQIQRMYGDLLRAGKSSTTVHHIHACLGVALEQARRWREIRENPCSLVEPPPIAAKPVAPLDWGEALGLLEALEGHRLHALFLTDLLLGLRQSELFGLRWSDLQLEKSMLEVRQTVWYETSPPRPVFEEAVKSPTSQRPLYLPPLLVKHLKAHQDQQRFERKAAAAWHDYDLVFARPDGLPFRPGHVLWVLRKTLKAASLPLIRFHTLRHTLASLHHDLGTNDVTVQQILGHATDDMLKRVYRHALPKRQQVAAERFVERLFGRSQVDNETGNA